jgi:hypothetical protein
MGEEDPVKNQDQKRYRSLWEMLQSPVRDTIRVRSLADPETPAGFLDLLRVCLLGFAGRRQEVGPQSHVNRLNNCRDRRIGHRLKLSLQSVRKGFGFLRI